MTVRARPLLATRSLTPTRLLQEESNWPLTDALTLKKKFDDIFAATKYTKALDALRKLRTDKGGEVKEMKLRLEHLKTHRDTAAELRAKIAAG